MEHFLRAIGVASGFWNGSVFGGLDPYGAKSLPNAFSAPLLPDPLIAVEFEIAENRRWIAVAPVREHHDMFAIIPDRNGGGLRGATISGP